MPSEPSSFSDELEFVFRHALIRDGAYESLPKSLRAKKHAQVARWAEERAGERAEEIAELIATHLPRRAYLDELGAAVDRDSCGGLPVGARGRRSRDRDVAMRRGRDWYETRSA